MSADLAYGAQCAAHLPTRKMTIIKHNSGICPCPNRCRHKLAVQIYPGLEDDQKALSTDKSAPLAAMARRRSTRCSVGYRYVHITECFRFVLEFARKMQISSMLHENTIPRHNQMLQLRPRNYEIEIEVLICITYAFAAFLPPYPLHSNLEPHWETPYVPSSKAFKPKLASISGVLLL